MRKQHFIHTAEEFANICLHFNGKERFWVSINPLKDTSKRIKPNVKTMMSIIIDIDTAGGATEETKEVMNQVLKYIGDQTEIRTTIPVIFSGNKGFHIWLQLEPIELSEDWKKYDDLLRQFIDHLNQKFSTETTKIDEKVKGIQCVIGIPYTIHTKTGNLIQPVDEKLFNEGRHAFTEFNDLLLTTGSPRTKTRDYGYLSPEDLPATPEHIRALLNGVGKGERNTGAFKYTSYLKDLGTHQEVSWINLQDWNRKNHPPLDEKELETALKSAYKYPPTPSRKEQTRTELIEEEEREELNLNEYPCLNAFFPIIVKAEIESRQRIKVARAIVSALHFYYPELGKTKILKLIDGWNEQQLGKIGSRLSPENLTRVINWGVNENPSCTRYNGIHPLRKKCTYPVCLNHDGSLDLKIADDDRLANEITDVRVFDGTETVSNRFIISLRGRNITLLDTDLMKPNKFILTYFRLFDEKLTISNKKWDKILNEIITQRITSRRTGEKIGTDEYYRDRFVETLKETAPVIFSWDEYTPHSIIYELDKKLGKTLWAQSKLVKQIAEKIDGLEDYSPRKLRDLLNPLMKCNTRERRMGDVKPYFWIFKAEKIGVKPSDKLDLYMASEGGKK